MQYKVNFGPHYHMAKVDLHHVQRTIPIHRSNYKATGLKWKFKHDLNFTYFVGTRLPLGGKVGPWYLSPYFPNIESHDGSVWLHSSSGLLGRLSGQW